MGRYTHTYIYIYICFSSYTNFPVQILLGCVSILLFMQAYLGIAFTEVGWKLR